MNKIENILNEVKIDLEILRDAVDDNLKYLEGFTAEDEFNGKDAEDLNDMANSLLCLETQFAALDVRTDELYNYAAAIKAKGDEK